MISGARTIWWCFQIQNAVPKIPSVQPCKFRSGSVLQWKIWISQIPENLTVQISVSGSLWIPLAPIYLFVGSNFQCESSLCYALVQWWNWITQIPENLTVQIPVSGSLWILLAPIYFFVGLDFQPSKWKTQHLISLPLVLLCSLC